MCVIKGNEIKLRYSLFRGSFVIDLLHEQKEQNKMSFFFFFLISPDMGIVGISYRLMCFKNILNILKYQDNQKYPICYKCIRSFLSRGFLVSCEDEFVSYSVFLFPIPVNIFAL